MRLTYAALLGFLTILILTFTSWSHPYHRFLTSNSEIASTTSPFVSEAWRDGGAEQYKLYSEEKLRYLSHCHARGTCGPNELKVVILGAYHCHAAFFLGYTGGEGIWCLSIIDSLERQGYTVLMASNHWDYILHLYRQIPDLVRLVIANEHGPTGENPPMQYYKTKDRPYGVPAWKHFYHAYFPSIGRGIVGDKWSACAEPDFSPHAHNFTYLGYALEPAPSLTPYIPPASRLNRVWILSKRIQYLYPFAMQMWPLDFYSRATKNLTADFPGFEFVAAMKDDRGEGDKEKQGDMPVPDGIRVIAPGLSAEEFDEEVGKSKVMLGVGFPLMSPSPWRAMARGVPFINPHKMTARSKPDDPWSWDECQHATLRGISEPQVYNAEAFNYDAFVDAIRKALSTPIEPYRPPWLQQEAFDERIRDLMEEDWKGRAAQILDDRENGRETQHGTRLIMFEL